MKVDGRIRELGDWRGETLARMRALILEADPEMTEEWKWMGTPVWSHQGNVCTGEVYTKVKLGETVDPKAFKALVKAAVALNASPARKR